MSFSASPRRHQLLFPVLAGVLICSTVNTAFSQHRITLANGSVRQGEIVGATATTVQLKVEQGTVGIPKAQVASIEMPVPAAFTEGVAAWEAGDAGKAMGLIRPLVDSFKGLPTDWAQQASGLLGDLYIAANDLASAEKAYQEFQQLYPGSESKSAEVGMARLDVSKKEYAAAKERLTPIATEALEKKSVSRLEGASYGQAFLLLGEIKEAEENYAAALEDYLRTVTIFHQDTRAVQVAQQKADALRKAHSVQVP